MKTFLLYMLFVCGLVFSEEVVEKTEDTPKRSKEELTIAEYKQSIREYKNTIVECKAEIKVLEKKIQNFKDSIEINSTRTGKDVQVRQQRRMAELKVLQDKLSEKDYSIKVANREIKVLQEKIDILENKTKTEESKTEEPKESKPILVDGKPWIPKDKTEEQK